ncbi:MAG: pyridoxal phosphate-dependent aminotransferase, partial [Candidatus Aadella gelida]|nr:pyridoxal phosphate-dependent aminotransferase [Candidatus Aadella gelida]
MISEGDDVVILAAGEPDFDTPEVVKTAGIEAINRGQTKYTPASGNLSLKKAICRKLLSDNGLEYDPKNIVVSCGAKHSIYNVLQVICSENDEVLIIPPYWLSYPEMIKLAGAKPVVLPMREGYKTTAEDIREAITPRTKAVIINSPSNPTGVIYGEDELKEIAKVCLDKDILIISDEIYEKILYDGKKHVSIAGISKEVRDATIVINGVSKSHSMTGWRIGYAAGNENIMKMVSTLQSHSTSGPCSISQAASECALTEDLEDEMKKNCEMFQKRRDFLLDGFAGEEKMKAFKPSGAFYMYCDISGSGMDSMEFSKRLLAEEKVAVIPCAPFGDDNAIRISFAANMKTLEEGVKRIKKWLSRG